MEEKSLMEKAKAVLDLAYNGLHHVPGAIRDRGHYVEVNVWGGLSTYDFNQLTLLVIGAHDECVRLEINPSGPNRIKLRFHNRTLREGGSIWQRHPTIEAVIAMLRERGMRKTA